MFVVTNKTKIVECENALLSTSNPILLLLGHCGTGRENTIKSVAKRLSFDLCETSPFDEGNIAIQVWEVLRFQKPNQKLLVVINDHDSYSMSSDCGSWKDLLVNLTKSNGRRQGNHKICLIAPPDIYDKRQIFDSVFHSYITEIKFNPVSATLMKKYLGLKTASDPFLASLETCGIISILIKSWQRYHVVIGDFRCARANLSFKNLMPGPLHNPSCLGKYVVLNLFHGIGKVIYRSKNGSFFPPDLIDSLFISADKFNHFIFENAIGFSDDIEDYCKFVDSLSKSSVLKCKVNWQENERVLSNYHGSIPSMTWLHCCKPSSRANRGGLSLSSSSSTASASASKFQFIK